MNNMTEEAMNYVDIREKRHVTGPGLVEVNFPERDIIFLDISTFNYNSATCCFTAVQEAIKALNKRKELKNELS